MKKVIPLILAICLSLFLSESLIAVQYHITIVSAKIDQRKPDGRKWDGIGVPPDPYVRLILNGVPQGVTTFQPDTYTPYWNQVFLVDIDQGDQLSLQVIDKDMASDDLIGGLNIVNPGQTATQHKFGSVRSFKIKIQSLQKSNTSQGKD